MQINAKVKPNTKHREEVIADSEGNLTVYTKAPATENRANIAAAQLIAKYLRVSKTNVQLVRGHTSAHKIFKIDKT